MFPFQNELIIGFTHPIYQRSANEDLKIKKKDGQVIVFNYSTSDPIRIGKFDVTLNGEYLDDGTASPVARGDTSDPNNKNVQLDQVAQHIIWNAPNSDDVTIAVSTGVFLVPSSDSNVSVDGTSSGWIVTGGTFTHKSGEFHNVNQSVDIDTELTLSGKKTIVNKPADMDLSGFKFTVKENGATVAVGTSDANGNISFSAISYTEPVVGGEPIHHTYIITEDATPTKPGVVNSTESRTVTVTVTRDDEGVLTATVDEDSPTKINAVNFENRMNDGTVSKELEVTKAVDGLADANWPTEGFTFNLEEVENPGSGATLPTNTTAKATSSSKTAKFGAIKFSKAGDYTFTITEQLPEGATDGKLNGITYDTTPKTVTVKVVEDTATGTLSISEVKYGDASSLTVTNRYSAGEVTKELEVTKAVDGLADANWPTEGFTFNLEEVENPGSGATLPTNTTAKATSSSKTAKFGAIKFSKAGDYTFTITEQLPEGATDGKLNGITYDTTPKTVTVKVVEDTATGTLSISEVKYGDASSLTVTNRYSAGEVTKELEVTKAVDGLADANWPTEGFTFNLEEVENPGSGATLPTNTTAKATSSSKTAKFGAIKFSKAGDYTFTITEQLPEGATDGKLNGITYDTTPKTVTVKVVEDTATGTLSISEVKYGDASSLTVTNRYSAGEVTKELEVTKAVDGLADANWPTEGFTFNLEEVENPGSGATLPTNTTAKATSSSKTAKFGAIKFSKAGDYTFTITEQLPEGATDGKLNGITYDTTPKTVTVKVVEDTATGTLSISEVKYGDASSLTVTNRYSAGEVTKELEVTKAVDGLADANWPTEGFTFNLEEVENPGSGATLPTNTTAKATSSSKTAKFGAIKFSKAGDYTFTITEQLPEGATDGKLNGITYDTTPKTVTVKVVEDTATGTLSISEVKYGDASSLTVTNRYSAGEVTKELEVTKAVDGLADANWPTEGFTFNLEEVENPGSGATLPTNTTAKATSSSKTAKFGAIKFSKAGDYTFTITEQLPEGATDGKLNGITYDTTPKTVTVKVVEDTATGTLSISEVKYGDASSLTVTNTYEAEKAIGYILKVDRELTKDNPVGEEGVQFQVYNAEFTEVSKAPADKRMLFIKVRTETDGTNVYRYTKDFGTPNKIATSSDPGDTLETGSNGMIRITEITGDMKLTAVETKNLPGYASHMTNIPTPVDPVDPETSAETAYNAAKTSGHYFIDAPEITELHVTKKFTDGNTRHPKESIEVTLYKIVGDKEEELEKATLNADNGWKATFANHPKRDDVGNLVKYQVRETKGGEGYTVSYSPSNVSQLDGDHKYKDITVTNTKEEEKPKESETPKPSEGPKQEKRVPKTSDNFNAFFWMSSLLVSIVTGCWAAVTLHRYE